MLYSWGHRVRRGPCCNNVVITLSMECAEVNRVHSSCVCAYCCFISACCLCFSSQALTWSGFSSKHSWRNWNYAPTFDWGTWRKPRNSQSVVSVSQSIFEPDTSRTRIVGVIILPLFSGRSTHQKGALLVIESCLWTVDYVDANRGVVSELECFNLAGVFLNRMDVWEGRLCLNKTTVWTGMLCLNKMTEHKGCAWTGDSSWTRWIFVQEGCSWTR